MWDTPPGIWAGRGAVVYSAPERDADGVRPVKHHRRSTRLKEYDYAHPGAYFVTVCTHRREYLFGEIVDGEMMLSELGRAAAEEWLRSADIRREIELDAWIVMPNHLHAIVVIVAVDDDRSRGARPCAPTSPHWGSRPRSLSSLMQGFKSAATRRINEMRDTPGAPVWQRNYYEHIIRDDDDLRRVRSYIADNPVRWADDPENLTTVREEPSH